MLWIVSCFTDGFCVSETENIRLFKDIFIQLYIPYSIKIREQAVIRMALFNYNPSDEHSDVSWTYFLKLKSGAQPGFC